MSGPDPRRERREERQRLTDARTDAGRDLPWRRQWRKARRAAGGLLVGWLAPFVLRLLALTWRVELHGALPQGRPSVLVLWHGRMLLSMPLRAFKHRGHAVLVSPSADGALVEKALRRFGYTVVRGSSSRGGAQALRDLLGSLRDGRSVVVTPDGPRGPRHGINVGPLWLAAETDALVVPLAFAVDRAFRFRSWDRCCIPKPWARIEVRCCEPLAVPAGTTEAGLEPLATEMRERLLAAEREGFRRLGVPCDHDA